MRIPRSFELPGNEAILSASPGFLAVCGKMLLHHHWHPPRTTKQRNYDRGEEEDFTESCTSLGDQPEWWWEHLQVPSNLKDDQILSESPS